jgi:hypothetical protein
MIPVAASLALIAGCTKDPPQAPTTNGVEALSAEEIVQRAGEALADAQSFRLRGVGEDEGETIELDVVFAGDSMKGTIAAAPVPEFEILVVEDGVYFKGGPEFWAEFIGEAAEDVAPLLVGKWVPFGADENPFDLGAEDFLDPAGDFTKGEVTTVGGKPAIIIVEADGSEVYISLEGEPYPIQVVTDQGTLEFLEFDQPVTIEAPPASEIFDFENPLG